MENLIEILEETPWWVFLIFAYLVFTGIKAAHRRTLSLSKIFLLPSLLTLWSFYGLYMRWQGIWTDLFYWIISLVLGSFLGWSMVYRWKVNIDREKKRLTLPGTPSTLILALLIFAIRYSFGYYYATHPFIPHSIFLADLMISGIVTGIFIGRSINFWYRYENSL